MVNDEMRVLSVLTNHTKSGEVWRHLLRVDWEYPFQKTPCKDRSANTTGLAMDEEKLAEFRRNTRDHQICSDDCRQPVDEARPYGEAEDERRPMLLGKCGLS
jgi:hypothetical protein